MVVFDARYRDGRVASFARQERMAKYLPGTGVQAKHGLHVWSTARTTTRVIEPVSKFTLTSSHSVT